MGDSGEALTRAGTAGIEEKGHLPTARTRPPYTEQEEAPDVSVPHPTSQVINSCLEPPLVPHAFYYVGRMVEGKIVEIQNLLTWRIRLWGAYLMHTLHATGFCS